MAVRVQVGEDSIGIGTVLFLIFLVLKLTHTIAWSWWWVFAPIWIPASFVVVCLIIVGLIMFLFGD